MDFIEYVINLFTHWPPQLPAQPDPPAPPPAAPPSPPIEAQPLPSAPAPKPLPDPSKYRKWRLTQYYVAKEPAHGTVPVLDKSGAVIGHASVAFFASLALEGSGILDDGTLVNVAGSYVTCDPDDYAVVWTYHKKYLSKRPPGYSGLMVSNDKVVKVLAFRKVPQSEIGVGYGVCHGIPLAAFRTLAADIGATSRDDPRYKGKGGLVPVGTKVHIRELVGFVLPDGTTHDGWCTVNDTGGGIFGAHFDVFIGYKKNETSKVPEQAHIWFEGIEDRVPEDYSYGLHDL